MKSRMLAAAAFAALSAVTTAAYADGPTEFIRMADTNKDGMISKDEAMKMVEKMYDKADTKKNGKLDKKQVDHLLKSLMDASMLGN